MDSTDQLHRTILDSVPTPILIVNERTGLFSYVNDAAAALLGRTRDTIEGIKPEEIYVRPADRKQFLDMLAANDRVDDLEIEFRNERGANFWVLVAARRIEHQGDPSVLSSWTVITDRKAAEASAETSRQELEKRASMLDRLLDSCPIGVTIQTISGDERIFVNQQQVRNFGADSKDTMRQTKFGETFVDPEHRKQLRALTGPDGKQGYTGIEVPRRGFDGREWWSSMTYVPFELDGRETAVVWVQDISEQKKHEATLAETEALLRTTLDNMPSAILMVDGDLNVQVWNERYRIFDELDVDDIWRGRPIQEIMMIRAKRGDFGEGDPDILVKERMDRRFRQEHIVNVEDHGIAGHVYQTSYVPLNDGSVVMVANDISALKHAQRDLAAAEADLRRTLDNMASAIFMLDANLNLKVFNDQFREFYDLPEETVHWGAPLRGILEVRARRGEYGEGDIDELVEARIAGYQDGKLAMLEDRVPGGRHMQVRRAPLDDGSVIVVATDITELKTKEQELVQARDAAEAASRAKADFLATMSHEIRTPMNGVIGMVDILKDSQLDENQKQIVSTIRDSAFSLLTIINDILDFSKLDAGKMALETEPISICHIVEGVAETLGPAARKKDIGMKAYVDPDIPDRVLGDQVRVRQVLFNLLGNAVKFTDTGMVMVRADLMRPGADVGADTADPDTVNVRFEIIDSGIGIPLEKQAELFKPFAQAESSTTRRFGGTGLGLSISHRLTEMMDGRIGVTSTAGDGSTFWIDVAFPKCSDGAEVDDGLDLNGLNILAAIGDARMRPLLTHYLEWKGANVEATDDISKVTTLTKQAADEGRLHHVVLLGKSWDYNTQSFVCDDVHTIPECRSVKFVLMTTDRVGKIEKTPENVVLLETDPVHRDALWRTIAVAAGRASAVVDYSNANVFIEEVQSTGRASVTDGARQEGLILFVEDNPTNQDVISRQLNRIGYAHEMAEDGEQGLKLWRSRKFDLVLTDCHMPVMNGYDLAEAIRSESEGRGAHVPIIAITAGVLQSEIDRCYEAGMDAVLTKPVEMKQLREALGQWLAPDGGMEDAPGTTGQASAPTPAADEDAEAAMFAEPEGETKTPPSALPAGPLEPDALRNLVGDDPAMIHKILKDFSPSAETMAHEIRTAYQARDPAGVGAAAHKLKSAARTVGAMELAEICMRLELAGKQDNWEDVGLAAPLLPGALKQVLDYIDQL